MEKKVFQDVEQLRHFLKVNGVRVKLRITPEDTGEGDAGIAFTVSVRDESTEGLVRRIKKLVADSNARLQ